MRKLNIHILIFAVLLMLSHKAFSQDENKAINVETQQQKDGKTTIVIKVNTNNASFIEVRHGYEDRVLIYEKQLQKNAQKHVIEDLENDVYFVLLKNSSGRLLDAESIVIK